MSDGARVAILAGLGLLSFVVIIGAAFAPIVAVPFLVVFGLIAFFVARK